MKRLYKISITSGLSCEAIGDLALKLAVGDSVIVSCERYQELGTVHCICNRPPAEDAAELEAQHAARQRGRHIEGSRLPVIIRRASTGDMHHLADNEEQAAAVQQKAIECIRAHALEMKVINTHYSFDRRLIFMQFAADVRIDFRELLKDLAKQFRVRIELRQIGVRDEAAQFGGIGTCGRPFCCGTFLKHVSGVNVRMAKQQGLSLNPQNISGVCGRLKCCLQFEADAYQPHHQSPKKDAAPGAQPKGSSRPAGKPSNPAVKAPKAAPKHPASKGGNAPSAKPAHSSAPEKHPKHQRPSRHPHELLPLRKSSGKSAPPPKKAES